ncbi:hypothetical protein FEM48_Zijuj01G0202400 [Ziziphus jujuba var. spinosa]|uniref:Bulb-type lectin domain-containing protein n=1 Tax=Ziziphus jujuba var. spinosa TaxID=714518 RepID=A0A978W3B9_ZIZJJ|nr:hypothetical protein FEM48_Zijuj01G0202400 [Ziziphus jujuba var. spinosa]
MNSNTIATLLNIGNFILKAGDIDDKILWKSFDYPFNTLFPDMLLGLFDIKSGQARNIILTSWLSPLVLVPGAFRLAAAAWKKLLLGWTRAAISCKVLRHLVGLQTTYDVWKTLEGRYASYSRSQILRLQTRLQSIKKGDMRLGIEFDLVSENLNSRLDSISLTEPICQVCGLIGHVGAICYYRYTQPFQQCSPLLQGSDPRGFLAEIQSGFPSNPTSPMSFTPNLV